MVIERLSSDDTEKLSECAELLLECFAHAWKTREEAQADIPRLQKAGPVLAAVEENRVIGFVGARASYEPYGWELHPLAVSAQFRRRGIGSLLIEAVEEEAAKQGAIVMYLGTDDEDGATSLSQGDLFIHTFDKIKNIRNKKNHPFEFYEKNGYRIVGVLPDVNGYDKPDIYMAKRLGKYPGENTEKREEKAMKDNELVKIFTSQDNIQAEMVLETFRNNEIPAYKQDSDAGGFMNIYAGNSMYGEDIFVTELDAQKAERILQEMGLV